MKNERAPQEGGLDHDLGDGPNQVLRLLDDRPRQVLGILVQPLLHSPFKSTALSPGGVTFSNRNVLAPPGSRRNIIHRLQPGWSDLFQ